MSYDVLCRVLKENEDDGYVINEVMKGKSVFEVLGDLLLKIQKEIGGWSIKDIDMLTIKIIEIKRKKKEVEYIKDLKGKLKQTVNYKIAQEDKSLGQIEQSNLNI
jgi:hypothetical protein